MKLFKSATLIVASILVVAGLQSCNSVKPISQEKLSGHWVLKTINGEEVSDIHTGAKPTIEFDFAESRISGSAGCNSYFGGFTLTEANEFTTSQLGSTMMICPEMKMENQFTTSLQKTGLVLELAEDGKLNFKEGEKALLVFKQGEKQVRHESLTTENLVGEWKLVKIADKDLLNLFGERVPTMSINEEGKVAGFAGCNRFMASHKIEDDKISFANTPAMTMMACDNLEAEALFIKSLSEVNAGSLSFGKLILVKDGVISLEFVKVEATE